MTFHLDPDPENLTGGFLGGDLTLALTDGNRCTVAELVDDLAHEVHHTVCTLGHDGVVHSTRIGFARRVDGDTPVVRIDLDDGSALHCTPRQLLLLPDGSWAQAGHLAPGALLLAVADAPSTLGRPMSAGQRSVETLTRVDARSVYEMRVEVHHDVIHTSGVVIHD